MQINLSQNSDISKLNTIDDERPIHNKTDIVNERLNDDGDDDLDLDSEKYTSRVLITGRFCLNENNKYELECEATVDGVPVVTHKEAHQEDSYLHQHHQLKPEVQDHQIQTDLTKDDIISHDDFVYKICNQGLHPAELNLHILFKGNSAQNQNFNGCKIPCTVTTGKVIKTNSNKSNVTNRPTGKTSSTAKTKRPASANRKSNANSKQSSPDLSLSRKCIRKTPNNENASEGKKLQKDKYKFNTFKPKIPPLKNKIDTQNKNVPNTEQINKDKPWRSISPYRKTKNERSKKDAENQEVKVLYQNEKTTLDSKYDDSIINNDGRPRSYSSALPGKSLVQVNVKEKVKEKKHSLGSVSKNNIESCARTANSLRTLVTGAKTKVLPEVKKPKPSTFQLPCKRSPPGSTKSKSAAESPPFNDLRKSPTESSKFSPQTTSLQKQSDLGRKKCSKCRKSVQKMVSGGDQRGMHTFEKNRGSPKRSLLSYKPTSTLANNHLFSGKWTYCTKHFYGKDEQRELEKCKVGKPSPTNRWQSESPKAVSQLDSPSKMSSREKVYKHSCSDLCIKSQLNKNQRRLNISEKKSRESRLSQAKRLPKESSKQFQPGSPSCCEKCSKCKKCQNNRNGNNSQLDADRYSKTKIRGKEPLTSPTSRAGSPTSYTRATSPPGHCDNHQYTKDCPKLKQPVEQDERQKKKRMLIEKFIQQMDGESEVDLNLKNKKKINVLSSNPNHTKVTVKIDSKHELYDLMFRKNSNNFGNLTVKKTVKQNGSTESSFPNSKKSKSYYDIVPRHRSVLAALKNV